MTIYPNPKNKRVKLSSKEVKELRRSKYRGHCERCLRGFPLEMLDMHHKKTRGAGGGDTDDNTELLCRECHTKIHSYGPRWTGFWGE